MDPITAFVTCVQAACYFKSSLAYLLDLSECIKSAPTACAENHETILQLKNTLHRLSKSDRPMTEDLKIQLRSIEVNALRLLDVFKPNNRLNLVLILLVRRNKLNESFAVLERQKTNLILYLTTEISFDNYKAITERLEVHTNMNTSHPRKPSVSTPTPILKTIVFFSLLEAGSDIY
jgi:hypothetical protein